MHGGSSGQEHRPQCSRARSHGTNCPRPPPGQQRGHALPCHQHTGCCLAGACDSCACVEHVESIMATVWGCLRTVCQRGNYCAHPHSGCFQAPPRHCHAPWGLTGTSPRSSAQNSGWCGLDSDRVGCRHGCTWHPQPASAPPPTLPVAASSPPTASAPVDPVKLVRDTILQGVAGAQTTLDDITNRPWGSAETYSAVGPTASATSPTPLPHPHTPDAIAALPACSRSRERRQRHPVP